mmetsp:Transcript_8054/g.15362  ORF Transcript_8054/g.15362 Transcript_8054/m.15362 type:complete len:318 (+) Transcript_8054:768-1721(+)
MVNWVAVGILETRRTIRHDALPLRGTDLRTKIGLWAHAENARRLGTHGCVARNNVVAWFDRRHTRPDRFHDTTGFVSQNTGKQTFRVVSIEGVNIRVTKCIGNDLSTNFPRFGSIDGNLFAGQRLFRGACYHGLALDGLSSRISSGNGRQFAVQGSIRSLGCRRAQSLGVKCNMIRNKGGDKVIRVIVTLPTIRRQFLAYFGACCLEVTQKQLALFSEIVLSSFVNQNIVKQICFTFLLDQKCSIVIFTSVDRSKIIGKGLFTPWAFGRMTNGSQRRDTGPSSSRSFQAKGKSSMATHAVSSKRTHSIHSDTPLDLD